MAADNEGVCGFKRCELKYGQRDHGKDSQGRGNRRQNIRPGKMDSGKEVTMAWPHNAYSNMGKERMLKQAIFEMYSPQEGDMLMDAPATDSWRELGTYICMGQRILASAG